ncbi:hypothetical protein CC1G_14468 [Coprinopsis cinerea okayama7|uniref:Extracellular mutant protein 11 C-terminal domain-containing protein n=1 Tax=Coprinopsis cinerea (strain Okayama-7 / 130 / ATCC MYA-4618 / FGSC 9003) TaxID=240176 RepID=D6RM47_COPC7|nr:hypothetical protein CC1G_14468 [Coprinopsis cinerea okayama7\|eukprot:XP_002911470.1 hypothetical protein CC1G_14468 [Coprinopsis cinerea okayama7\
MSTTSFTSNRETFNFSNGGSNVQRFKPNPNNPLHAGDAAARQTAEGNLAVGQEKTVKTSGIAAARKARNVNGRHKEQGGLSNANVALYRPSTADPHSQQQRQDVGYPFSNSNSFGIGRRTTSSGSYPPSNPPVVAPTPKLPASVSPLLTKSLSSADSDSRPGVIDNFKVPELPSALPGRDKPISSLLSAHIPNGNDRSGTDHLLDRSDASFHSRSTSRQSSRTPDTSGSSATLFDHDSSLLSEKSVDSIGFKLPGLTNTRGDGGPRRVALGSKNGQHQGPQLDPEGFSAAGHVINENGRVVHVAGKKRGRGEVDDDDVGAQRYQERVKRMKLNDLQDDTRRRAQYDDHPDLYHDERSEQESLASRPLSGSKHPSHQHSRQTQEYTRLQSNETSTLDALFGADTDAFIKEHMDQYDRLVDQWTRSTEEEWLAGADALIMTYTGMLDFIKNHFLNKVKFYRSLHARMDAQDKTLEERGRLLVTAKEDYRKGVANVIHLV